MNLKLIFFILLGFTFDAAAQQNKCEPTLPFSIKAESGMRMRAGPGTNHKVVVYVPAKSTVLVCKELDIAAEFEGIKGNWRRVKYKNKYGYMFDGFLNPLQTKPVAVSEFKIAQLLVINKVLAQDMSKMDSVMTYLGSVAKLLGYEKIIGETIPDSNFIEHQKPKPVEKSEPEKPIVKKETFQICKESYNFCGDIQELDPGKKWYAVYREGEVFRIKRIELMIIKSKYNLGSSMEFDIKSEDEISSAFLLASNKNFDPNWYVNLPEYFFEQNPRKLFPGQQVEIYAKDPVPSLYNIYVYATGEVTGVGKCPEMKNYRLNVNGEMHDKLIQQDLTPMFSLMGDCGIPEIMWFGDLNEDKYPDIVFASIGKTGITFTLFVSDTNDTNVLYRKAHEWSNLNCE